MRAYGLLGVLLACLVATPAFADPPPWAPAHGRREKAERHEDGEDRGRIYRGYTGDPWADDFGVSTGRCNTDAALAVIGAILGGIAGNAIGDAIDDRDRACMGHSFEVAPVGRVVEWRNAPAGAVYRVKPLRDLQGGCREVEIRSERTARGSRSAHRLPRAARRVAYPALKLAAQSSGGGWPPRASA